MKSSENNFSFPFSTCETPMDMYWGKSQFYSGIINLLSAILLFVLFTFFRAPLPTRMVIFFFFLFEIWHSYSHFIHIKDSNLQFRVIHIINYFIAFSLMVNLQLVIAKRNLPIQWILFAIYFFIEFSLFVSDAIPTQYTIVAGSFLFFLVLLFYLPFIPKKFVFFTLMVFLLGVIHFLLESFYCSAWMKKKRFPYHIILETIVMILLISFSWVLIQTSRRHKNFKY